MTERRWANVWKLYSELRDSSGAERSAALAELPADVRDEVLALLEQSDVVSQINPSGPVSPMEGPESEYPPGTVIGRYVITGLLGEGGFGRVYSAHDKDLRRGVAIKILSARRAGENIIDEARAASALNHPNILTIHENIEVGVHPAMVMEFVHGRSLRRELAETGGALTLETAVRYGAQIAQALDAAHSAGIVHRDVKPENILVRPDGYLKLVDFGLASTSVSGSEEGWRPFTGTLRYTSPEQLKGAASSPASDVFSLGLVLYEMVAGVHPFRRDTPLLTADAIARHIAEPPSRRNPSIPETLDALVLKMLSKDPSQRPRAAQVAESLRAAASAEKSSTSRTVRIAAGCLAGLLSIAVIYTMRKPSINRLAAATGLRLKVTPLTGNPGRERRPAISSDGQFVVFEWQEKPEEPERTIVREIGTGRNTELPLTGPFTWVPGTHRIAYRERGPAGDTLFTVSRYGDDRQQVMTTKAFRSWSFSPDGKYVAYVAPHKGSNAVFRYTIATGEHKQLTDSPPPGDLGVELSHDGRHIAVRRAFGDVYVSIFPEPGEWQRIVSNQAEGEALTWLRDGSALITSGFMGSNNSLWLHPMAATASSIRLTSVGVEAFQANSAADLNRIVWLHAVDDTNIWRMPSAGGQPVRVVASLFRDADVAASPTGLLAFRSDRSGYPEIWVAGPNGENQRRITSLEGFTGSPRWSADGRRLAFDSRLPKANGDVWTVVCDGPDFDCQRPQRITDHPEADVLPNWSRDGKQVYFASRRTGSWQLWRASVATPAAVPVQLSVEGGYFATESADGKWLYYSRLEPPEVSGLWRRPLDGKIPFDTPGELVLPLERSSTATWNVCGEEVFYQKFFHRSLGPLAQTDIAAYNMRTRRTRKVVPDGVNKISRGLAVSADCKSVYFSRLDRSESNIVWADYDVIR